MAHYWAPCAGGLEFVLLQELQELEGIEIVPGIQSYGGVQFRTTASPQRVANLRSADNVYSFLGHFKPKRPRDNVKYKGLFTQDSLSGMGGLIKEIPQEREAGVTFMKSLAAKIDWKSAMDLHSQWQGAKVREPVAGYLNSKENGCENSELLHVTQQLSFRVTGDRISLKMKKHGFTSMEAAAAIGDGIHEMMGWPADMKRYNVEVLAWIIDDELLLALALIYSGNKNKSEDLQEGNKERALSATTLEGESIDVKNIDNNKKRRGVARPSRADAQLYSRRPYRQALVHTSLKPSTAYALLQLAQIRTGDVVLDPMCGCGTIPLEAGDWLGRRIMSLAGDLVHRAVESAHVNSIGGEAASPCDVVQWDAGLLPLRTACIDCVVCDMPFGNRCGNFKVREWLCPKVVKQVVRVLRPGTGMAVLMGQSKTMKEEVEVTQKAFLDLLQHLYVDMEGIRVDMFVVRRTMELAPAQVVRMSRNTAKRKRDWHSAKQAPLQSFPQSFTRIADHQKD